MGIKSMFKANNKCLYCQRETVLPNHEMHVMKVRPQNMATIDHYIPLKRGGADDPSNKVLACLSCNHDKHHLTHEEYMAVLAVRAKKEQRAKTSD